ncbi:MAG TPA: hybrid sensor histidine kinase/response regulator, partial [Porphyromonadaceae bacterium]|nr:hybrid sensor histidine kinase/response regulator [Porphyromonadaceae bacterium]
ISKTSNIQFTKLYVNNYEVKQGDHTGILDYTLSYTDKIRINPSYSVFSVEFATDNYLASDPEDVEYRLNGYESRWMNAKFGRMLTYTNLNPGNYTLEVRSKSTPGITKSLKITIPPPFYKSPFAYILYILVFISVLYWIIRQAETRFYLKTSLEFEKREKEKNEELIQSKLRFFTNISHEIRTPITLIMGQTDHLLQSHRIHPSTYNKILNIHKNASNLNGLINELLDFRKQELGHLKLKISPINFIDFLQETYIIFGDYAINRNISFNYQHTAHNIPLWIDTEQMQKVINNLLSNAFKFTPEGGSITISVEENENEVTFTVKDTGKGITADNIKFIFDRFYQIEKNDNTPGTGIGLALTKGIVTAHAGQIRVESEIEKGSAFIVTLKKGDAHFAEDIIRIANDNESYIHELKSPGNSFVEEVKKSQQEAGSEQSTLLIVEDNKEVRELLRDIFNPIYKTEVAADGLDGLEKVWSLQPDIVISDIMMPGMSGIELCKKMKNNLETCHIPIILLTAKTAVEHKFQVWKIGADDYITKPFDIKLLIIRCNNLVNSRKLLQKKYIRQTDTSTQQVATTAIDKSFISKATAIVEKNMNRTDFNMDLFARELGLGRTTLFNKLRGITGLTPNNFITNIRLKKAADLLLNNPEMNISEIAYSIGFSSPGYFNKCFKNLFGSTPIDFRKKTKIVSLNQ